jgi:curved DNA-binding protein
VGPDGKAADIYLVINVADDPKFTRKGDNLHTQVDVDVFTAILGGEASVKTLTGEVILTIPPGTQPEQVFRLTGRGMPKLNNQQSTGDLYVRVKVKIPRLNDRQRKAIREVSEMK